MGWACVCGLPGAGPPARCVLALHALGCRSEAAECFSALRLYTGPAPRAAPVTELFVLRGQELSSCKQPPAAASSRAKLGARLWEGLRRLQVLASNLALRNSPKPATPATPPAPPSPGHAGRSQKAVTGTKSRFSLGPVGSGSGPVTVPSTWQLALVPSYFRVTNCNPADHVCVVSVLRAAQAARPT